MKQTKARRSDMKRTGIWRSGTWEDDRGGADESFVAENGRSHHEVR